MISNKLYILIVLISITKLYSQPEKENIFVKTDSTILMLGLKADIPQIDKTEWYTIFSHLPSDYYNFINETVSTKNTTSLVGLTFITSSLLNLDQRTWRQTRLNYNRHYTFRSIDNFAVSMGDGKYHFLLAGLFSAYGIIFKDERALKTAFNISEAVLASGICIQVLKRISGRETPIMATRSEGKWRIFPNLKEYQKNQPKFFSFPSGHIATASATLTVIANNYPEIKWIKPVGYSLLGLIGVGLVGKGMHWYSDLPFGMFLGYSFGNIVSPVKSSDNDYDEINNMDRFCILPNFSKNNMGLSMVYSIK